MTQREGIHCDSAATALRPHPAEDRSAMLLRAIAHDLLVEVEALRAALLSTQATRREYARAYRRTTIRAHVGDIVERFYPPGPYHRSRAWREMLLLRRFGASDEDLIAYREEVEALFLVERVVFFHDVSVDDLDGTLTSLGAMRGQRTDSGCEWKLEAEDGSALDLRVIEDFGATIDSETRLGQYRSTFGALGSPPEVALEVSPDPASEEAAQRFLDRLRAIHTGVVHTYPRLPRREA